MISKLAKEYRLFLSLFLASFIFLSYPYRFFSAEGYFPIIFLSALPLNALCDKFKNKNNGLKVVVFLSVFFILFFSPTVWVGLFARRDKKDYYKLFFVDSALIGMLFPAKQGFYITTWFPRDYLSAADAIRQNSEEDDIVYSSIHALGVYLASISGRATANALFPEISASRRFDPLLVSKIVIIAKDENPDWINSVVSNYKLLKIGESKLFIFYKNPFCNVKTDIRKASVPFSAILMIIPASLIFIALASKRLGAGVNNKQYRVMRV